MEIAAALGNQQFIAQILPDLAWVCCNFGDYAEGRRLAQEGVERSRYLMSGFVDPRALRMLGWMDERRPLLPQLVAEDVISSRRRLDWSTDLEQLVGDLSRAARAS